MIVVIKGEGKVHLKDFSKNEALNHFLIEANSAYYMMPDIEFVVTAETTEDLLMFIANPDI